MGFPGPERSLTAAGLPAIAMSKASPGPVTSGPVPIVQSRSVARSRSPLMRGRARSLGFFGISRNTRSSRCAGMVRG